MSNCGAEPGKGMVQIIVGTVSTVMTIEYSQRDGNEDIRCRRYNVSKNS